MYFIALATDYDGTLAENGKVDADTVAALKQLKNSGRRLILVTGRELSSLQREFPDLYLFDLAVVENGALLYDPREGRISHSPTHPRPNSSCGFKKSACPYSPSVVQLSRPGSQ
jgi:HAD superfamily hydrolase (TIGR01484 family)